MHKLKSSYLLDWFPSDITYFDWLVTSCIEIYNKYFAAYSCKWVFIVFMVCCFLVLFKSLTACPFTGSVSCLNGWWWYCKANDCRLYLFCLAWTSFRPLIVGSLSFVKNDYFFLFLIKTYGILSCKTSPWKRRLWNDGINFML